MAKEHKLVSGSICLGDDKSERPNVAVICLSLICASYAIEVKHMRKWLKNTNELPVPSLFEVIGLSDPKHLAVPGSTDKDHR